MVGMEIEIAKLEGRNDNQDKRTLTIISSRSVPLKFPMETSHILLFSEGRWSKIFDGMMLTRLWGHRESISLVFQ